MPTNGPTACSTPTLRYRQRQVNTILDLDDFVTDDGALPDNLDQLQGDTRELRYDADIGVAFGTSTPSSYGLRFFATQFDYSDDDTDRAPRTTLEGQGTWTLQLDPGAVEHARSPTTCTTRPTTTTDTELHVAEVDRRPRLPARARTSACAAASATPTRKREDDDVAGVRETTQDNNGPSVRGDFRYTTDELVLPRQRPLHHGGARPAVQRHAARHLPACRAAA